MFDINFTVSVRVEMWYQSHISRTDQNKGVGGAPDKVFAKCCFATPG